MNNNSTEQLLKGDKSKNNKIQNKYKYTKDKIKKICNMLSHENYMFRADMVIKSIDSYLHNEKSLKRILYSEISGYIFSLDIDGLATFASNIDTLKDYALKPNSDITEDCIIFIIKLYDHCQLAFHQVENTRELFDENVEVVKEKIQVDIKEIEKEYITILGIFAAIVLAFVSGLVFSNSILKYMSNVSIFRLIIVIDLLAVVLVTTIYLLIKFIMDINSIYSFYINIKWLYIIAIIIAFLDVIAWGISANKIAASILQFMPWR